MRELLQSEAGGQLQQRYTFLYARAPDLRMDDVPILLRQYKELILKHEAMVCAVEAHRSKQQSGAAATQAPPTAGTPGFASAVLHVKHSTTTNMYVLLSSIVYLSILAVLARTVLVQPDEVDVS